MSKRKANLTNAEGAVLAIFNETCHGHGTTAATIRLRPPLAPFLLSGTESLALYAESIAEPVLSVTASDPDGIEISEFHGTSSMGCLPDKTKITLIKSPGGDLSTLLIVLAKGTVTS